MHPGHPRAGAFAVLLVTVVVLLASAGPVSASASALTTDKGVVQDVSSASIVLRGLDGSTVTLALGPRTTVRLNGVTVPVGELRPGLVASVTHNGDRPARIVRAFGAVAVVERGTVESISKDAIVLRRADGTLATVAIDVGTKVRRFGRPAGRSAVRVGRAVRVTFLPGSPAKLIAVVRQTA